MRTIITLFIALSLPIFAYSQKKDTLHLIQGTWEFQSMKIEGDTSYTTKNFHATDLTIENEKFNIGLSEAYAAGHLEYVNKKLIGTFKYGDHVFEEMSIQKLSKHTLIISLTTSTPEYWTGTYNQTIIIYLHYKK